MSNITISGITEQSLETKSDYSPIPAGNYNATIFDVKAEEVRSGANAGKPRFNIQFKITGPEHANRRVFGLVPLYVANDFWKTQAFFSALGYDMKAGNFAVPEVAELLGKAISVRVKIGADQNGEPRNEISGFDASKAGDSLADLLKGQGATENVW
jgi:hypothetical protein